MQNLRLALKARHAIEVLSERIRKNFDGDVSPQFRVGRAKNRAHPTFAQFGGDPVSERSPIQSTSSPSFPFIPSIGGPPFSSHSRSTTFSSMHSTQFCASCRRVTRAAATLPLWSGSDASDEWATNFKLL